MNTRQILNQLIYPAAGDNVRRKSYPKYDQQAIAAGTLEYYFFVTPLGNRFIRNAQFPLAGSEIFFVEAIKGLLLSPKLTTANVNVLDELLQQCYLQVTIDNRKSLKIPGLDFISYQTTLNEDATPEVLKTDIPRIERKLPLPIVVNSTSAFEFKLVLTAAVATALDGVNFDLVLHGVQFDKLESFTWNDVKDAMFQQVSATYYDTVTIPNGNEQVFPFFATPNKAQNLFSQTFPLSDIQNFMCQAIEVFIGQPDTPIVPYTIYNNSIHKHLNIRIDDVEYYDANLANMLSVVASYADNITTAGADTIAYVQALNKRDQFALPVSIGFPANGKVQVTIAQPAASLPITGEITLCLRGIESRRVA